MIKSLLKTDWVDQKEDLKGTPNEFYIKDKTVTKEFVESYASSKEPKEVLG